MDPNIINQQLPLSTSSTGPQIRSRITVVCAECKRLKLKCDRRTPCGSCTKRDTVARCIYSPAAAEKVDLHSLNNRLIQVESTLALITAGQAAPAFQSSYPFSYPSSSSSCAQPLPASFPHSTGGSRHHHHHHSAAAYSSENDSLALSAEDLTSIWLEDLDLGVSQSAASSQVPQSHMQNTGFIKLEPSPTEMELTQSHHGMITLDTSSAQRSVQTSRSSSPFKPDAHQQQQQQQFFLPPLSIYHSAPATVPSSPSAMSPPPYPTPAYTFLQSSQYSHPQITSALLSQLPSFSHSTKLLRNAEEVFRMRPIPINTTKGGWKAFKRKCLAVLSGPLASQHERDAARQQREARKAKAIYFHGGQAPPGDDMDGIGGVWNKDGGGETSLSFFACMCAVLAVGAHAAPSSRNGENSANAAFLYALSQQALGIWETHASSAQVEESERMDFLLASLVCTVYVLYSRSASSSSGGEEDGGETGVVVSPLVGKMFNVARLMGLGRDVGRRKPAKSKGRGKEREREEMKRMVWWDILFYDLFTSDILGQPPLAPSFTYTTRLPECASTEEDEESEHEDDDDDAESGSASSGEMYFGVRCRLTQLAQMIKQRMATPDCCCGYTLDQAASLDSEVRRFIDRLPAALRLSTSGPPKASEDSSMILDSPHLQPGEHPEKIDKEKTMLLVQSAELAIMANLLVWKIYLPFLRPTSSSSPSSSSSQPKSSGAFSSASQACVTAAQEILGAAKVLLNTNYSVIPTIFDFYPLNKVVFDATAICAHASLTTKFNDKDLEAQLAAGLECASKLNSKSEWRKTVLVALNKRMAAGNQGRGIAASSLKRKRSQQEHGPRSVGSGQGGDSISPSGFDALLYQGQELQPSSASSTTFPSTHPPPPTTQRGRESLPSPPTSRASGSAQSKTSSTGGKDKKQAKKTHTYPAVGIRARLKESGPLVPKHKSASETTTDGGRERGKMQAPPPLMTSAPRMMSRESSAANMYPPQQSPVHSKSSMLTMSTDTYRSRSSSLSHVQTGVEPPSQQSHSLDYSPFTEYRMREQQHMSSPSSYESSPQMFSHPHQQQQVQASLFDLGPPPPHGYDHRQHTSSFDRVQTSLDSAASYASTGAPSPCANPSHSSTSSPYTSPSDSVGGQPPTPTLTYGSTAGSHHPNPPAFVHSSSSTSASSPTGYIHFEPGCERSSGSGLSMAGLQATIEQAAMSSVPSTPATYERQGMYDAKPPMDALLPPHAYESLHSHQIHQQEQFHRDSSDALQPPPPPPPAYSDPHQQLGHPHHRMTSVEGDSPTHTWPGPPAPSQATTSQPFWNGYA